jgi:hypothetical protein
MEANVVKAEPKFGVKYYEVIDGTFWLNPPDDKNPVQKILVVEFLNGRIYHSRWSQDNRHIHLTRCGGMPESVRIHPRDETIPIEETDMELLVVENFCHEFFNPIFQPIEKPLPKDEWDADVVCDGSYNHIGRGPGVFLD